MNDKKLLPCPCCGEENTIETFDTFVPALKCTDCGLMMTISPSFIGNYKKELYKKWNTRKPIDRIVERLEELKEEYAYPDDDEYTAGHYSAFKNALKIVKEEGGLND